MVHIKYSIEKSPMSKHLTAKMKDYLEAIFDLYQDRKVVRVRDIAKRMDVKMPTVTSMLKALKKKGLIQYEKYEYVELTLDGDTIGREIRRRHEILIRFLTKVLSIELQTADEEACKMEHALSGDTLNKLTDFVDFIQGSPRVSEKWSHFSNMKQNNK